MECVSSPTGWQWKEKETVWEEMVRPASLPSPPPSVRGVGSPVKNFSCEEKEEEGGGPHARKVAITAIKVGGGEGGGEGWILPSLPSSLSPSPLFLNYFQDQPAPPPPPSS